MFTYPEEFFIHLETVVFFSDINLYSIIFLSIIIIILGNEIVALTKILLDLLK